MRHARSILALGPLVAVGVALWWDQRSGASPMAVHPAPSWALLTFAVAAFIGPER